MLMFLMSRSCLWFFLFFVISCSYYFDSYSYIYLIFIKHFMLFRLLFSYLRFPVVHFVSFCCQTLAGLFLVCFVILGGELLFWFGLVLFSERILCEKNSECP